MGQVPIRAVREPRSLKVRRSKMIKLKMIDGTCVGNPNPKPRCGPSLEEIDRLTAIALKAKLLCEGFNADEESAELFARQNPSKVKRGGLSAGGKMLLKGGVTVNAPLYRAEKTDLRISHESGQSATLTQDGQMLWEVTILPAPDWYGQKVGPFNITQIVTAHNRQLAAAVYEDCCLFARGDACRFCVMNRSLSEKAPALVRKSGDLIVEALRSIPVEQYGGLTLNGGMTTHDARGMELFLPVVSAVHREFPSLPIAVEITPPSDLDWIDRLAQAGASGLMMNLECWDPDTRARIIPGKSALCPRESYLKAFERGLREIGKGRITTCFVVGTEPFESLKKGIETVTRMGVIPSPLAGRRFEDIPDYPVTANVNWRAFLNLLYYAESCMQQNGLLSTEKAGCVACGMCDLIRDIGNREI